MSAKMFILPMIFLFASGATHAQNAQAKSCDKPYQIGRFVQLDNEDLRLKPRRITEKESKEWKRKQAQAQIACNAFVSKHPNRAVSEDFSFTVKGFTAVRERCESFCGTFDELMRSYDEEKK